jgi:1-acyl-sn-glycerol-3-phosphate acyltransferase
MGDTRGGAFSRRPSERRRTTSAGTRLARAGRLLGHLLHGVAITVFVFPFATARTRSRHVERWSRRLLAILHVRLHVEGERPDANSRPALIVANHVSWLDIFLLDAVAHVRFVGKSEIRRWPVIGWLSTRAGTMYIERSRRRDTGRINRLVAAALERRELCAVFPEGTTTIGDEVLPFHASLLQPAVAAGADVIPVAIRFARPDGTRCEEAAYDGDKSLLDTMRLMLTQPRIEATLRFLPPIHAAGRSRREVAEEAARAISLALGLPPPRTRPGTAGRPPAAPH